MAEVGVEPASAAVQESEAAGPNRSPHKLERKWTFWFDNQSKPKQPGAAWGTSMRKVYTFDTVEEFWCLYDQIFHPSKLPGHADFHCFKTGIEPKWEDPECANGGKWSVTSSRKTNLDTMWLETLMALIGEQFEDSEDICGVVASVRQRQDKLALWTKSASNEAVQVAEDGIPLPPDRTLCPLCSQKRANPSVVSVSGFVFCYACIFKYISQYKRCPVTLIPATVEQIRRLFLDL